MGSNSRQQSPEADDGIRSEKRNKMLQYEYTWNHGNFLAGRSSELHEKMRSAALVRHFRHHCIHLSKLILWQYVPLYDVQFLLPRLAPASNELISCE